MSLPAKALAATVRYLKLAERDFGRADLAVASYHMGIGNLMSVLDAYDGGQPVPYVKLFFDTAPDRHPKAYRLLSGFGDDSWTYLWRVLGAEQIMRLYRTDPSGLTRLGLTPALSTSNMPPPSRLSKPSAIWLRAELPVQRMSTRFLSDMTTSPSRVGRPRP